MPNGKPCTVLQLRQCCSTAAVFTIAPTTGGWRYNHFRQFLKTFLIKNIYLTKQEREIKKLSEKVKKKKVSNERDKRRTWYPSKQEKSKKHLI